MPERGWDHLFTNSLHTEPLTEDLFLRGMWHLWLVGKEGPQESYEVWRERIKRRDSKERI